jgi:signal transduction histidine kinase
MRRLLGVLRDEGSAHQLAPQPGLAQLDDLIVSVRTAGLPVRYTVTGVPAQLPPTRQAAIYRVVQEALTNVLKHGKDVRTVSVGMTWTAGALAVDICDDGRIDAVPEDFGHGLTGMRERVSMHGGTMSAGPGRTRGWRVHARFPFEEAALNEPLNETVARLEGSE